MLLLCLDPAFLPTTTIKDEGELISSLLKAHKINIILLLFDLPIFARSFERVQLKGQV